jgi:hypothetical protein
LIRCHKKIDRGNEGRFVKIAKVSLTSRYFAAGYSDPLSSRSDFIETEPVHTIVADRDAMSRGHWTSERKRREEKALPPAPAEPPVDEERRHHDRRQRQIEVLLDTRVAANRRHCPSVNEEA